jgi:hypothetical protein
VLYTTQNPWAELGKDIKTVGMRTTDQNSTILITKSGQIKFQECFLLFSLGPFTSSSPVKNLTGKDRTL